ncbi:MAG: glycosyltransferase family 39 protein [Chloroflexota bacterium]
MARVATTSQPAILPSAAPLPRHRVALLPVALPVVLVCAALALRLFRLDHESLWLDEGYTLLFSQLPLGRLITVGGAHEHPPLYYLLVHTILHFHHSYMVPRVISSVAGALSAGVLYLLGQRLYGRLTGTIAAILFAVSPFQVWYGQDGRGYALAGLLVLVSYLTVFIALDRPSLPTWTAYAVATAAALYGEYTALFVLIPQALLLVRARRTGVLRSMLLAWTGALALFAPWLGVVWHDAAGIASDYWIPSPRPGAVASTVLEFVGAVTPCPSPPCTGHEIGLPLLAGNEMVPAAIIVALVLAAGIWAVLRRDVTLGAMVAWLLAPFVLVLLLALRRSLYLDRIFLDATFPLYILIGVAVAHFKRRWSVLLAALALLFVTMASLANLGEVYGSTVNPDWKSPMRDLAAAYRPGQAVVFNPGVLRFLDSAYLPPGWHATQETRIWSRVYLDVPGWQSRVTNLPAGSKRQRQAIEATLRNAQLTAAAKNHRQVWLVTMDYSGFNDTRRWFSEHGFRLLVGEMYTGDTRLELWDRLPASRLGSAVVPAGAFRDWSHSGTVRLAGGTAILGGHAYLSRTFTVAPGLAYSVSMRVQGIPPAAKPLIALSVFDRNGKLLGTFPNTRWYDFPLNGAWLSAPFGFVAPPGAARATLSLGHAWGQIEVRNVGVYREPTPGR